MYLKTTDEIFDFDTKKMERFELDSLSVLHDQTRYINFFFYLNQLVDIPQIRKRIDKFKVRELG